VKEVKEPAAFKGFSHTHTLEELREYRVIKRLNCKMTNFNVEGHNKCEEGKKVIELKAQS